MWRVTAFFLLFATPATAFDLCDDLWFTRNLVFDRAGYCFSSPLGKSVFGNKGCTTTAPGLDAEEQDVVAEVKAREEALNCAVDTNRTKLNVDMIPMRKAMLDLPLATEFEAACSGWRGPALELYNARSTQSHGIGFLQEGDTIGFLHESRGPWYFVTQLRDDEVIGVGWVDFQGKEEMCDHFAP